MDNLLSVDLEEWYHFRGADEAALRGARVKGEPVVVAGTLRLLSLFREFKVQATFFVLGKIAAEYPGLVREVSGQGHEIGLHGYEHVPFSRLDAKATEEQIRRCREAVAGIVPGPVVGFRAPFLSGRENPFLHDSLARQGLTYDSSLKVSPTGARDVPGLTPEGILEFPLGAGNCCGRVIVLGGAYLRLLPQPFIRKLIRRLNARGMPGQVFLHPRDILTGLPKARGMSLAARIRYCGTVGSMERKLRGLLAGFSFTTYKGYMEKHCRKT